MEIINPVPGGTSSGVSDETRKKLDALYSQVNSKILDKSASLEEAIEEEEEAVDSASLEETQTTSQPSNRDEDSEQDAAESTEEDKSDESVEQDSTNKRASKRKADTEEKNRNYYRLLAEKKALSEKVNQVEREKEDLKNLLGQSYNSNTYYYARGAYQEHEKAVEDLRKAMADGDTESFVKANQELIRSQNNINKLQEWELQEKASIEESEKRRAIIQNNQQQRDGYMMQVAQDWVQTHPYLVQGTSNFNPRLAGEVNNFVEQLDGALYNQGQQGHIYSPGYFEALDKRIEELKPKYYAPNRAKAGNMPHVGSVKNANTDNRTSAKLHPLEERMMERLGKTKTEWLKQKQTYM